MAEYREYISALRQCAKEHENENLFTGQIDTTALCNDTAKLLENDVIERSKVDKAIEEIDNLTTYHKTEMGSELVSRKAVLRIIDKWLGEKKA